VSIELSCVVLACCMEVNRQYSAFFVSPVALDSYPRWKFFDSISYMKYGYVGLVLNEYEGWIIPCTKPSDYSTTSTGELYCKTGDQWADSYGYKRYNVPFCKSLF
jgi:hypothetical protein